MKEENVFDLISIEHQINLLKNQLNPLLKIQKELKESILEEMENDKVRLFDNDEIKITMVMPKPKKVIDENLLKEKYPEVYQDCLKETTIKSSLRITLKGEKYE